MLGASQWTNIQPSLEGLYKGQNWEIGEYKVCPVNSSYKAGEIFVENGKTFLACKDGITILKS
jgi:hypothetical protein